MQLQHRIETIQQATEITQQAVQQLQATEIIQQAAAQVHLLRQSHPIQAAVLQRVERMQTEVQS